MWPSTTLGWTNKWLVTISDKINSYIHSKQQTSAKSGIKAFCMKALELGCGFPPSKRVLKFRRYKNGLKDPDKTLLVAGLASTTGEGKLEALASHCFKSMHGHFRNCSHYHFSTNKTSIKVWCITLRRRRRSELMTKRLKRENFTLKAPGKIICTNEKLPLGVFLEM